MKKYHYVYHSYEEWGREYIGCRTCNCLPEEDTKYFGSFCDKTFKPTEKTILFVCETRKEAAKIEIELHNFFDVGVNPQFANRAKAVSTGFSRAGVIAGPRTEEVKKKISKANFGKTRTEAQKKANSERNSGEKSKWFGVPKTKEWKKERSERNSGGKNPNYGKTGALSSCSKAIIAIKPGSTQQHYGSICEAARELGTTESNLRYFLKNGHVSTRGKWKGWQFLFKNSENFYG